MLDPGISVIRLISTFGQVTRGEKWVSTTKNGRNFLQVLFEAADTHKGPLGIRPGAKVDLGGRTFCGAETVIRADLTRRTLTRP